MCHEDRKSGETRTRSAKRTTKSTGNDLIVKTKALGIKNTTRVKETTNSADFEPSIQPGAGEPPGEMLGREEDRTSH